jgi:MFS transporter, DHA1 family, tetracycline resistance protein
VRRSPLLVVYLAVFLDLLGFGIILPSLPFYAERFGATGLWVGAILTAYSAAQFVGALYLGRLSDRIGRRPVLLTSLLGSAVTLAATGLATSLPFLLASRLLAGGFGGSIATAQAYIADVTTPKDRTKYMGMLGASIGMGFIVGPAIGGALSLYGFSTAAFVAAGLAAANFVLGLFLLPETRRAGTVQRARLTVSAVSDALRSPAVGRILISTFLATFAFVGMEATFALLGQVQFQLNAGGLGFVLAFIGVVVAVVQGGVIGRLNARYGECTLASVGVLLMGVSLAVLPFLPRLTTAMIVLGVLAVGDGLATPTLSSLLSLETPADDQGATLGLGQSLSAAARATGPILAGWLFDRGIALPYLTGGLLLLVATWLILGIKASRPTHAPAGHVSSVYTASSSVQLVPSADNQS